MCEIRAKTKENENFDFQRHMKRSTPPVPPEAECSISQCLGQRGALGWMLVDVEESQDYSFHGDSNAMFAAIATASATPSATATLDSPHSSFVHVLPHLLGLFSFVVTQRSHRDTFLSDLDLESLNADPGDRKPITEYNPNIRDEVRRHYIQKKPCQLANHDFPKTKFGKIMSQFCPGWFKGQHSKWLEYNISKDAAYCLCCYLFKNEHEIHGNTGDAFTKNDFKAWNKAIERFKAHVGEVNSIYNKCFNRILDLKNQSQSIRTSFDKQSEKEKSLPFRGHDESQSSTNRGIFLELLQWYGDIDRDVGSIILENSPRNEMMYSPSIQKDIVDACAKETVKAIIEDMNGDFFGILVDESKDISHKEQMALVLRYVNNKGEVIETFVGIVHVSNTSAMSLKKEICSFLSDHSLSPTQIRGQGYDGASNMQGELNGVKTLIFNESPSAYCIHYFGHQLQLTLVAIAKKHSDVDDFFWICFENIKLKGYKICSNQIIHVLEFTARECPNYADRIVAESLMGKIKEFDFAFMLHLMLNVLTMTNELSCALQRMDQDIVNAMGLLALTK
uniref:Zinc finger MYM-type protein 1-like n=1 Tax=Nicotiana sylvestris TaxID=4096 RepID=A0A1U7WZP9_NICSY|nr:PREDICTED: zinc finger MYM-type protein 1-like [Nicotiana sylvestris]